MPTNNSALEIRLTRIAYEHSGYSSHIARAILDEFVVIPKSDLPEVQEDIEAGLLRLGDVCWPIKSAQSVTPGVFRKEGLESLALANYLDANPPVDEAQVEAVKKALRDADEADEDTFARRLVRAGVRVEGA